MNINKIPHFPKESPLMVPFWNKNKKLINIYSRNGEMHYLMPESIVSAPKRSKLIERREILRKPLDYLSFSNYH